MTTTLRLLVCAGALALACAPAAPPAPSADEVRREIEARNEAFRVAYESRDASAVAALYTEDGSASPPNATSVTGHAGLAEFWGGVMASGVASARLTTSEVFYAGGDVATESGSAVLALADGSIADEAKYIVVWKKTDAGWRMLRDLWNSNRALPAPPAAAPAAEEPAQLAP